MLASSPVPGDGAIAIHDHEGFPGVRLHEHDTLDHIAEVAGLLREHGEVFGRLYGYFADLDEARRYMADNYQGCFESIEAWAMTYLEDAGELDRVPPSMRPYLSLEDYARDCIASGDILCFTVGRQVAIFFND
jgi:antirestriction protein